MTDKAALTGGATLADRLVAHGVKTVFSLAGAGHTFLLLPLQDRGVRIIGTRHETGAVGAADGYARASGTIGVATIIAEQGLPNAISAISTAYHYGSPVVVLVTRFPDSWVEAAGEYAVDHHALLTPITKWVRTVPSAAQLPAYFDAACRMAREGRPGPAVLVIPQNFLASPVAPTLPKTLPSLPVRPQAAASAIDAACNLLRDAARPALLIDSGCCGPAAIDAVRRLHDDMGIPVFTYGGARGLIAEDDLHALPWPFAQIALPHADLLIVAGARLNMWFGFGRATRFPEALKVIQIDADAASIGRNRPVTLGIVADPGEALLQLAEKMQRIGRSAAWLDEALAGRRAAVAELRRSTSDPIHALAMLSAIEARRPQAGIVVGDGADILNWSYAVTRISVPRGYMDHHPLGSMGMGLPLAIGAAAAEQDIAALEGRPVHDVTLVTGDGALGFYIAELDTVRRESLPIKIFVANDGLWGTEFHGQMLMTGRYVNTRLGQSDYATVARGFGMNSVRVGKCDALAEACQRAYDVPGPHLTDVAIDPEAGSELKRNRNLSFLIFSDLAPPEG